MILPRKFLRQFRWSELPRRRKRIIAGGLAVTSITATFEYKFQECIEVVGNPAQITSTHRLFWLRVLYGRTRSRWFGSLSELHLPVTLRAPVFKAFAWAFDANLEEVRYPLDSFHTINDFFARALREGARPIENVPRGLVSPVDAEVVASGEITSASARIEQVKGATYSVPAFLGVDPVERRSDAASVRYVVLYLAPGDYHRIHAPCALTFSNGRHFAGELLPLRSKMLQMFDDIFTVNERVVLSGRWNGGQMHLVAVAAQNVGNIYLDFDQKLKTNRMRDITVHCGGDVSSKLYPKGVDLKAGDLVGGFRLGSTIVLVLDTPEHFQWNVAVGDRVKVGQKLGDVA
eukprot:TRINITY_DN50238_c0_g1_i1.p1 TRINITY_DN50238_c0_g1~~TRINITY_DN50238_c0_g1_i1.p1  ORF type:complete len:346 (+),score=52.40 TRINITY_DN50238_c0_g1_i1:195-1232(+)